MKALMCGAAMVLLSVLLAGAGDAVVPAKDAGTAPACKAACDAKAVKPACSGAGCETKAAEGGKACCATKAQAICPVMDGNAIDRKIFVDHEGQRIYFCCKGCVAKFKADPAAYLKKLAEAGVKPEATPAG